MTLDSDWTNRGRELSAVLDARHAVVIVGSDAVSTSEVALGIARVQSQKRRVAIADVFGEAPPLQSLITGDDEHGIVDSFLFGVSLNKIAQQVPESGDLFIMPSGSTPIDYEELFAHPRWRRLAAGFREVGALLIIVAPAESANIFDLVDSTDGAIIVGDIVPREIPVAQSIAWLRPRRGTSRESVAAPLAVQATRPPARDRRKLASRAAGLLVTLGLLGLGVWFARRPFAAVTRTRRGAAPATSPLASSLKVDSSAAAVAQRDSVQRDSTQRDSALHIGAAGSDSFPVLAAANKSDSAAAAAWAVQLEQTNTKSGAILDLRGRFETVPAGTYGFDTRTRFFLLVAGAYQARAGADSLLLQLRHNKILAPGIGSVASLPYAFLVQADVPVADVPSRLKPFAARGQPVYALRQQNGAVHLYFGAYESAQQAALAVPAVKEAGLTPTLVYRIGRVF